jgi:hypothetical protein
MGRLARIVSLIGVITLSGCAYTLQTASLPQPALVELPNGRRVSTPGVLKVRWAPFNTQIVRVTATGYRPLTVDLRERHVRFGRLVKRPFRKVKSEVEFVLVPVHGAVGTWDEGSVPD